VVGEAHRQQAALIRKLLAVYARSEDLVRIGAYKSGADADLDRALRARDAMRAFFVQAAGEQVRFPECVGRLAVLAAEV
jgi:flagellum-specific ATP synthase